MADDNNKKSTQPSASDLDVALQSIMDSGVLGEKSRLRDLLAYLIREEGEGRGERIKALSIAMDVLGRGEDFDPVGDSIVRVEINRLRQSLEHYYSTSGAQDSIRIDIPKGTYRPAFSSQPPIAMPPAAVVPEGFWSIGRRMSRQWLAMAALAFVIVGFVLVWFGLSLRSEYRAREKLLAGDRAAPIIEIRPFADDTGDSSFSYLAAGLRTELISELSHIRLFRVRAVEQFSDGTADPDIRLPDYFLRGSVSKLDDKIRLTLILRDANSLEVLWSTVREVPVSDSRLFAQLIASIRAIVNILGGPTGVMQAEEYRRLESRVSRFSNASAHACLLRWYDYDLTKDAAKYPEVRKCLSSLVAANTQEGSIWAAYGFMLFLEWSQSGQDTDAPVLDEALRAIQTSIRLDPTNSVGYECLASVLLAKGSYAAAVENFQHAIELNPSKPQLRVLAGWSHMARGDWLLGEAEIERGLAMTPNPPGWYRIPLSMNYFRRGDFPEALEQAELIALSGDERGVPLALAAAIALGDWPAIEKYRDRLARSSIPPDDPMRPLRSVLNVPVLVKKYERVLEPVLTN
jgi:TolB-like protein